MEGNTQTAKERAAEGPGCHRQGTHPRLPLALSAEKTITAPGAKKPTEGWNEGGQDAKVNEEETGRSWRGGRDQVSLGWPRAGQK
jgi:hypothetical protein